MFLVIARDVRAQVLPLRHVDIGAKFAKIVVPGKQVRLV
jgi:hypothetical protein